MSNHGMPNCELTGPPINTRHKRRALKHDVSHVIAAGVCCLIFIISSGYCLATGDLLRFPDEPIYVGIAERLLDGAGFTNPSGHKSAFRPPGYPYLIYLIFNIKPSILLAKLFNSVALALTGYIAFLTVRRLSRAGGVLAPLLILCYPILTFTTSVLVPQIPGGLLLVLVVYLLARDSQSSWSGLACGLCAGILVLLIPAFALVFLLLLVVLLVAMLRDSFCSLRFLAIFFAMTMTITGAWTIRSSLLFDRFVFISTNAGINLLYGNSDNTTFDSGAVDISTYNPPLGLDEAEQDAFYKARAKEWILGHPAEAAMLYMKKSANYFNFRNKLSTTSEESQFRELLLAATYYPLLIAAIIRCSLWYRVRFCWTELLMYILYFSNAFMSAIVYTRVRYRVPFDLVLIIMVAIFLERLLFRRIEKPCCETL